MTVIAGRDELRRVVSAAALELPCADTFTRLDARTILSTEKNGIDALLTDDSLLFKAHRFGDPRLLSGDRRERADAVFELLFTDRSPIGDAAQAVLLSLSKLGMHPGSRSLQALRSAYQRIPAEARVIDALDMAGLSSAMVQVDLFDSATPPISQLDDRLRASIRVEALSDSRTAWPKLSQAGCRSLADVRELILRHAEKHEAESLNAELESGDPLFAECALPAASILRIPVLYAGSGRLPDTDNLRARIAGEGFSFRPFQSGARVLEQLPGLWAQARRAIAAALTDAYAQLLRTGWQLSAAEISHDIEQFLGPGKKRENLPGDRMENVGSKTSIVYQQEVL